MLKVGDRVRLTEQETRAYCTQGSGTVKEIDGDSILVDFDTKYSTYVYINQLELDEVNNWKDEMKE